jgi:hypothetical protein
MAKTRNRYVKVALFEAISTNLIGGTIVGQIDDWMLVERPQPKPRAAVKAARKPRATNAKTVAQGQQELRDHFPTAVLHG